MAECGGDVHNVQIFEPGVSSEWVVRVDVLTDENTVADYDAPMFRHCLESMLEIEHLIATRIAECGTPVARIVYTFGGRDVHLHDGSRIEFRWQFVVSDWRCLDCGVDTSAIDEYYMVHNPIWEQVHPSFDGQLCIGCLEDRLGRTLTATDFTDRPINTNPAFTRSARLRQRLNAR